MAKNDKINDQESQITKEKFQDLVIFTTTLYGDDEISMVRKELAEKFFNNAKKLGIKCVVVDGGSSKDFIEKVSGLDNVELIREPSLKMGESRRSALQRAIKKSGASYFLWSEPEKYSLLQEETLSNMMKGLREGRVDIVVPKRKSKDTMPEFQARAEDEANKRATNLMRQRQPEADIEEREVLDLWFGPKMFNRQGAEYFLRYNRERGELDYWDSIIKPALLAYRDGKKIVSVEVDFDYDERERKIEEGKLKNIMEWKRAIQYGSILAELGDEYWQERVNLR